MKNRYFVYTEGNNEFKDYPDTFFATENDLRETSVYESLRECAIDENESIDAITSEIILDNIIIGDESGRYGEWFELGIVDGEIVKL